MDKEEIVLSDWRRIVFGEAPVEFLVEVLFRTLFTYFILLIVIRLLGKRMSGQLTSAEMAVMLLLGAIVSVPMQDPARGIFQGAMMLFLIFAFQQTLSWWMTKSSKAEDKIQGTMSMLVKDGVILTSELLGVRISREQLFAVLRAQQIFNLGTVQRLYLEACGDFSTYKLSKAKPGLSILPRKDEAIHQIQQQVEDGTVVCVNCGHVEPVQSAAHVCLLCGESEWEKPVV